MTRLVALACLIGLLSEAPSKAEADLFGRSVGSVLLTGAPADYRRLALLPIRPGQPLLRHQLQQSVRLLYRTGRYARVTAWIEENGPESVSVEFQVEPARRIARVSLVGARSLDEGRLLRLADLPAGTPFESDRLTRSAAALAQAYFRGGWRDAQVRWDAEESGGDLTVDLSISEGDPTRVGAIEFTGDVGLSQPELEAALGLKPGERLDLDRVDAGLAALRDRFRSRGFHRARVPFPRIASDGLRARVTLELAAGPRFAFQARGASSFPEALLLAQLRYTGAEPLDGPVQQELADRLRDFYEKAGFPEARVVVRESSVPVDEAGGREVGSGRSSVEPSALTTLPDADRPEAPQHLVTFIVEEGTPRRVLSRSFPGMSALDEDDINRRIDVLLEDTLPPVLVGGRSAALLEANWASGHGPDGSPAPWRVRPHEVFSAAAYRAACGQIQALYKSEGFLDAEVGPARLELRPDGTSKAVIPVVERARTVVRAVRIAGASALSSEVLRPLVTVDEGDPLNFAAIEESRQALATQYQSAGHLYVQVEDQERIDPTTHEAEVLLTIDEGPQVRIGRIELKGAARTDPALVRGMLTVKEGDVLTPQGRQESARNILKLGVFAQASLELLDPDTAEAEKTVIVEVREKPGFSMELRGGASYADGPRASGQVTWGNLRGRNWTASLAAKLNWPVFRFCLIEEPDRCTSSALPDVPLERRLNAGLVVPQFQAAGRAPMDVRLDLVHEALMRPSYQLAKFAGLVSFDGLLRRRLFGKVETNLLLQAELERDAFARRRFIPLFQTLADRRALLLPQGTLVLASVRPALTLDARDDKMNPTSGTFLGVSMDLSKALTAADENDEPFDIQMLRLQATVSGYVPLSASRRVVLALSARGGRVFKKEGSKVIGTKRFFLGGTQSLRGFSEDGVYPEDVRGRLREALDRCRALASGLGCDEASRRLASGVVDPSPGGELSLLGRAELRVGLLSSLDGALFFDAGNLWSDPANADLTKLRYTAGLGVRYLLPIGPAAFDCGVNLNRDADFGEPPFRIHLAIGLF